MGSGGTFCPQKSFESTGSRRERAHPLDGCQESIACATSEHGSRRDGSRSGVALGFERAINYSVVNMDLNKKWETHPDMVIPSTRELSNILDDKTTPILVVNGNNDVIV